MDTLIDAFIFGFAATGILMTAILGAMACLGLLWAVCWGVIKFFER